MLTTSTSAKVRAREIKDEDVAAVLGLLAKGFTARPRRFWRIVLAGLKTRAGPPHYPRYGYLLESEGVPVGVILLIFSELEGARGRAIRCNVSSWYVEPAFRAFAGLLVLKALGHKGVTYLNVTAAPHTRPMLQAQGYAQYADGVFVAVPATHASTDPRVDIVRAEHCPHGMSDPLEQEVLLEHARYGCVSLWCKTQTGLHPFILRTRFIKGLVPCAQLIYCRSTDEFVRFAGPIGRYLAVRGWPIVILDANGPIPGLLGKYFRGRMPKYYKGPLAPRLGDLAYTEAAMFGI